MDTSLNGRHLCRRGWIWCLVMMLGIGTAVFGAGGEAPFRGEITPLLQGFQEFISAALATDSDPRACLKQPYASEALGPGFGALNGEKPVWAPEAQTPPLAERVARWQRGVRAFERGPEVLSALEKNFLPPSALQWLLPAHRLSIGTTQEPQILNRVVRHLIANRYPIDLVWKAFQYAYTVNRVVAASERLQLEPGFLAWEVRALEAALEGTPKAVKSRVPVSNEWFPQSPDRLYDFSLLMLRHGRLEAAREAARRFCRTSFWGVQAYQQRQELAVLAEAGAPENPPFQAEAPDTPSPLAARIEAKHSQGGGSGGAPTGGGGASPGDASSEVSPDGIRRLTLEVSQPLPDYNAPPRPRVVRDLTWDGRDFISLDGRLRCQGDIVAFLVRQARSASPSVLLPAATGHPYQVRATFEFDGKPPIIIWGELGPNRWMSPLFIAVDGSLRYTDDSETIWATLHLFHRNSFLEELHQGYRPTRCGTDLSSGFYASFGVVERPPEKPLELSGLAVDEKADIGHPIIFAPRGLLHPVVIQRIHVERKRNASDPRSSVSFYRRVIGSDPASLPTLEEILEVRKRIEMKLGEVLASRTVSLSLWPGCDYGQSENHAPERWSTIGFDIEAGMPAENSRQSVVKLLKALGQPLPGEGPFPVFWRFRANWPGVAHRSGGEITGYWLDFARILVVSGFSVPLGDGEDGEIETGLRAILGGNAAAKAFCGSVRVVCGFDFSNHSFSLKPKGESDLDGIAGPLKEQGWTARLLGAGKDRSCQLAPPKGRVYYLVKKLGEPLRMARGDNLAIEWVP